MNLVQRIYHKILVYLRILPYRSLRFFDRLTNCLFIQNYPPQPVFNHIQELGGSSICHMNRNLLNHFKGVYQLLKKWGNCEYVC